MKSPYKNRIYFLMALLMLSASACGGGGGGGKPAAKPCPENAPALSSGSGEGTYLFYTGCGLWAVDPSKPSAPGQVTPAYVQGSLQRVLGGTWDTSKKKVMNQALHTLIYADPKTGHFHKISARLSDPIEPVQVSSEANAHNLCGVIALLEDYADINNSLYLYTVPGPDQSCGLRDDNIEKFIKIGMTSSEPPVVLPPNREVFSLNDLVDKDSGAITGWLAIKPRQKQRVLPAFRSDTNRGKNALITDYHESKLDRNGDIKKTLKSLGFMRGTPVMISPDTISGTGPMGGLSKDTIYIVDSKPSPATPFVCSQQFGAHLSLQEALDRNGLVIAPPDLPFQLETTEQARNEVHLKKLVKKLCLENGEIVKIDFDASDAALAKLKEDLEGHQVVKATVVKETVFITSNNPVKINRVATYKDFYRCDLKLRNCNLIKETRFKTFCAVGGLNLMGSEGTPLGGFFVVEATDHHGNLVSGVKVHWRRGDQEDDDDDLEETTTKSGGPDEGRTGYKGTLGTGVLGENPKVGWDSFSARIAGAGAALGFKADTKAPQDRVAPSCRRREEYFIAGVFPQPTRGSRAAFSGKIVLRMDLLYKPNPGEANSEKANEMGTMGILYVYEFGNDIESGILTTDTDIDTNRPGLKLWPRFSFFKYLSIDKAADGTTSAFPDHLPFVYDASNFFFADRGKLYRLPLSDSGKTILLANEQTLFGMKKPQFVEMKLTKNRLVYSLIDLSREQPLTALKSVLRSGFFSSRTTLLENTDHFLLPIITDESWDRVYFETLGRNPDPAFGTISTIFDAKEDGSDRKVTDYGGLVGRTRSRVLATVKCDPLKLNCAGGTLASINPFNPDDQISLGIVPSNIEDFNFDGLGEDVLGEGSTDSEIDNVEIFFIRGNQAGSLTKTTETPLVPEAIL